MPFNLFRGHVRPWLLNQSQEDAQHKGLITSSNDIITRKCAPEAILALSSVQYQHQLNIS